jgi:hypothetical protein
MIAKKYSVLDISQLEKSSFFQFFLISESAKEAAEPRTEKNHDADKEMQDDPELIKKKQGKDDQQRLEEQLALDAFGLGTRGHRGRRRRLGNRMEGACRGSSITDTIQMASMIRIPAH